MTWYVGIGTGIAYGLLGYGKKTELKDFSWKKYLTTVIICGVAGVAAEVMKQDISTVSQIFIAGGADTVVENVIKLVKRMFF